MNSTINKRVYDFQTVTVRQTPVIIFLSTKSVLLIHQITHVTKAVSLYDVVLKKQWVYIVVELLLDGRNLVKIQ